MGAIQYRSVEEIAEVLQDMKVRKRSCSLLVGAGVSIAAGIPTAAGFVEIIRDRYKLAYARAAEKTYPQCMAELLLTQRRALIGEYVDKARINWAHIGIALLMKAGYIDRVLTTNFDLLVVRACALLGFYPAAYDFAASQMLKTAELPEQAVFYLHGQRTGFVLMNTLADLESHAKLLGPVFEDAGNGRSWIVVGYSGANDPVFEQLARQPRFDNGLFWVGNKDREPQAHVRDRLLTCDKDAFLTKGHDADSFFVSLTQALQIFPPDVVGRPFTYMRAALEQITPFVHPGLANEMDAMRMANQLIERAIEEIEKPAQQLIHRGAGVPDASADRAVILNAAQYLSLQGNYEAVINFRNEFEKEPSPELADLISMAYVVLGNRLHDRAKIRAPGEAEALFEKAREMYETALSIKPDRHEALHNWANLLLDLAKASSDVDAERYFTEAEDRFSAASRIKPDQPEILINWGNLLLDRAKSGTRRDASELFLQAEQKYRSALAINPALPGIHYGLGNLLLDRAKTLSGPDSDALFGAAEEQYGAAIASDPNMAEAFYQWGNVYLDRAKRSEGAEADRLFEFGMAKFQQALHIKPDMYQALNNWGNLLMDQGKTKEGEVRDRLFERAVEKYRQATLMRPDFYEAWNNWGNLLLDWRKRKEGVEAQHLFEQAADLYREAHRLRPDMPDPLDNWGNLLLDHAKTRPDEEADPLFAAACAKFDEAHRLRPSMYQVLNNWGNCLSDQARRKIGEAAQRLFGEAEEKYRAALELSGKGADVLQNYVNLLMDSGRFVDREEARRFAEGGVAGA